MKILSNEETRAVMAKAGQEGGEFPDGIVVGIAKCDKGCCDLAYLFHNGTCWTQPLDVSVAMQAAQMLEDGEPQGTIRELLNAGNGERPN